MFSIVRRGVLFAAISTLVLVGSAEADPWHVAQSSGSVWFGSDTAQLVSLGPTADVPGGATVMTGEGARAFLVRGSQTMLVGPNTVITLPDGDSHGITTVLERAGEVTFDVDRQTVKHFAVETPYLAAVVKGTKFTVHVDEHGATVAVERGLVGIQDLATGDTVDTPAGQTAQVDRQSAELTVSGSGPRPVIQPGNPRAPLVDGLSHESVHALQVAALDNSGNSTPGLTPLMQARDDGTGAVVAAAGSIGPGGDDSGGNASGGSGGGRGVAVLKTPGPSARMVERSFFSRWFAGEDGEGFSPQALASIFGLSIALALGLAFFKGKLG